MAQPCKKKKKAWGKLGTKLIRVYYCSDAISSSTLLPPSHWGGKKHCYWQNRLQVMSFSHCYCWRANHLHWSDSEELLGVCETGSWFLSRSHSSCNSKQTGCFCGVPIKGPWLDLSPVYTAHRRIDRKCVFIRIDLAFYVKRYGRWDSERTAVWRDISKETRLKRSRCGRGARCKRATVSLYSDSALRFWSDPAVWTLALDSASPSSHHRDWSVLVRQKHIAGKPNSPEIRDINTFDVTYFTCEIHRNFQHVKYMYLMHFFLRVFHTFFFFFLQ